MRFTPTNQATIIRKTLALTEKNTRSSYLDIALFDTKLEDIQKVKTWAKSQELSFSMNYLEDPTVIRIIFGVYPQSIEIRFFLAKKLTKQKQYEVLENVKQEKQEKQEK
jgi:hypothetical protein